MAVKRNYRAVHRLLGILIDTASESDVISELENVMTTDDLADALEGVASNWGILVSENGYIY